jgi:transcription-repair coupling factor (superfamily II helicase)
MAVDLLQIYGTREKAKGYKYGEDTYLQHQFEAAFPYEYTADQIMAISDIKADMQSTRIVERLICGDVGFGKTEVALVAAFKAIQEGKQVALICPTTILCEQHFNTVINRLKPFMVNVAVLNRFKTPAEQKKILEDLASGKIDFICGTHRLLSGDVAFKDLGMLILDEEQRFGVEHKEKLKAIKSNVDVLTLTATPIPRTLYMSLVGIRDISYLNTPPKDRIPVETLVTDYSDTLLVDACKKELDRDGQVLIVYNRVETIYDFCSRVKKLLPDVNISVTHGQMAPRELEANIHKLFNKQIQILISTVLIENGIDLPFANTLIIIDADKLGLAQLYQLRGRIGRSTRTSYAYFTFARNKVLSIEAYKRLDALMEFSGSGNGYKIALRDLEIRGAGDLLGSRQHGHIQKVGYDLYIKLLNEAVGEIKGEQIAQKREVKIDIAINAYLPAEYITKEETRILAYTKISKIQTHQDLKTLLEHFRLAYGRIPPEVEQLMYVALIKNLCEKVGVRSIKIDKAGAKVVFYDDKKADEIIPASMSIAATQHSVINFLLNLTKDKP